MSTKMSREISSSTTSLNRIGILIFPAVALVLLIISTFQSFRIGGRGNNMPVFLILLLFFVGCGYANWIWSFKYVAVDSDNLYITQNDFFNQRTIAIRLTGVEKVRQSFFQRSKPERVTIYFYEPNEFGTYITFIPKWRFLHFYDHPIVEELNQIVHNAKMNYK